MLDGHWRTWLGYWTRVALEDWRHLDEDQSAAVAGSFLPCPWHLLRAAAVVSSCLADPDDYGQVELRRWLQAADGWDQAGASRLEGH